MKIAERLTHPKLGLSWIVHIGNSIFLLSIFQSDMLSLRQLAVTGTMFNVCFLALQPVPLISSAMWSTFFTTTHLYQICVLKKEKEQTSLTDEQEHAYELAFLPHGFTPRQFLDMLTTANGRFSTHGKGDFVQKRGEEMELLHILLEGQVEICNAQGDTLHVAAGSRASGGGPAEVERNHAGGASAPKTTSNGGWLGEFFDPIRADDYWEQKHPARHSIACTTPHCKTLAFERHVLDKHLKSNPRLSEAATRAELADLWGKLRAYGPTSRRRVYKSMLEITLCDGVVQPEERRQLEQFRKCHSLTDEEHLEALAYHGWSAKDFADGKRSGGTAPTSNHPHARAAVQTP